MSLKKQEWPEPGDLVIGTVETVTDYGDYEQVNGVYYAFAQASGPSGSSDRNKVQIDKAACERVSESLKVGGLIGPEVKAEGVLDLTVVGG